MVEQVVIEVGIIPVVAGAEAQLALRVGEVQSEASAQANYVTVLAAAVASCARGGGEVHNHVVLKGRAFGGVPGEKLAVRHKAFQFHLRLRCPQDTEKGVVGQVLADAGRVD